MIKALKKYYIDNSTNADQLITLYEETSCGTFVLIDGYIQTVPANTKVEIVFPEDGTYHVYVDGSLEGTAHYYPALFSSMIVYIGASICGFSGINCLQQTSCTKEELNYINNALSKVILYASVHTPEYDETVALAMSKIRCSAKEESEKLAKQEKYIGVSYTDNLAKIELSHIYMELYAADKLVEIPGDLAELKLMYNYEKISYCIQRLGVMDCDPPPAPAGTPHGRVLTADPMTFGSGAATDITLSYRFTANGDEFVAILDTNIPNVNIGKFDGFTYNEVINGVTAADTYYITYSYLAGGLLNQNTVSVTTSTLVPQWFGGESPTADFKAPVKAYVSTLLTNISTPPVYQASSAGTSSNSNTINKYIYWITKNPIRFFIGAFEITTGPWSDTCNPNAYAIITKTMVTVMEDGVTEETLHYYRTCPLQDLTGQTLEYTITE